MGLFSWGKRKKMPPMFKCIICEHRGADGYHYELPVCRGCKSTLHKHIATDGGAVAQSLEELRQLESGGSGESTRCVDEIILRAGRLVPYEDLRLKTLDPQPTEIIRRIKAGEYEGFSVKLWLED